MNLTVQQATLHVLGVSYSPNFIGSPKDITEYGIWVSAADPELPESFPRHSCHYIGEVAKELADKTDTDGDFLTE